VRLVLGSPASCTDGAFGELVEVVVDPLTRKVAHLVIEPHHRHWLARLVPIELAWAAGDGRAITLSCTIAEARRLELVQHSAFLRLGDELVVDDPDWEVGMDGVLVMPYYGSDASPSHDALETAVYDRIPKGEIEIRRSSRVTTADDVQVGHVEGFVVDAGEHITHVLLERGHLWGKRELTIPVGAVDEVGSEAIALRLTNDEVGRLAPVPVRRR
jgi:sporulation protein YlmC with PRC-barrel domain